MRKRILLAALDWGLGHATRCIPLVRALQAVGAEVLLASSGRAKDLLQTEFSELPVLSLPAYGVHYQYKSMYWNMALQMPKIMRAIGQEYQATQRLVRDYAIEGIISDNRYGCFHRRIKTIFLTHQVQLQIPNKILQTTVNQIQQYAIHQFDACWIPDWPGAASLAGALSELPQKGRGRYIGPLSRMQAMDLPPDEDIVAVLSGPEPQRSRLEHLFLQQAAQMSRSFLLIQGITDAYREWQAADNIRVVSFLTGAALNATLARAQCIICRAGYSSIMDLVALGKPAILIPTPGQTEQEYLAARFAQRGIFYSQAQADFNLHQALEASQTYTGWQQHATPPPAVLLQQAIQDFLEQI